MMESVSDMSLLSALFGRPKLSSLENQVLTAVSAELSPKAREVFNKQINLVNLVQRHADGKEVNLYSMRRGKPVYEEQFLFPLRREVQLGKVEMLGGRAEVWLIEGWVFSIHFDKPPKTILGQSVKIEKVTIFHNPMIPESADSASDTKRREELLASIPSKLPDEYLQLVGEDKGTALNDWAVSSIQRIRKIVDRDANYYLLAEKEGMGVIGAKEDDWSGHPYYLAYEDGGGEKITVGFREFLEKFDGGKVEGRF
jgi:hypothetical protein